MSNTLNKNSGNRKINLEENDRIKRTEKTTDDDNQDMLSKKNTIGDVH